jgi:hypothetical protein
MAWSRVVSLELSAVFLVSFWPTGVAVKSTFVVVVPVEDEVDVLDVELEPVLVESLAVVLVDFVDFGDFGAFVLVVVPAAPDDFEEGPCVLVDGPCALPEFPCDVDDGPCVDEGPCDVVCAFGADGPWLPELPCCASAGSTVNDTAAITPAEILTTRIA